LIYFIFNHKLTKSSRSH